MEEFREFTGKTVEDAITNASVALGLPSSELEIDILDKGSNGRLFGIGAKDAVINARIRSTSLDTNPFTIVAQFALSPEAF